MTTATRKPAPLATLPVELQPKRVFLLVRRDYDLTEIVRAYLTREAAERNITLGHRSDYIKYLERHAEGVDTLHPDVDPSPRSFVDFASGLTDLTIEEVEVIG